MQDRIVLKPEACRISGLSQSSLERLEKTGDFPKRIRVSSRRVCYKMSQLMEWLDSRPTVESSESTVENSESTVESSESTVESSDFTPGSQSGCSRGAGP